MVFYPLTITLHIIFAGIWIAGFITDIILKSFISNTKEINLLKDKVGLYLSSSNLFGMIGASGILLTGIFMVSLNPGYGFFDMSSNHWLATKQILMVFILLLIFAFLIPKAKKLRLALSEDQNENQPYLAKLISLNRTVHIIVLINFLLAITHRFIS
ncbi:MAG: hypothetical protein FJ214_04095 [Ignavibacteria bacterium]|nr:hypothetical protein [Ignavibacteria bacterium]